MVTKMSSDRESRRRFLGQVGGGMIAASIGSQLAFDMGLANVEAAEADDGLSFGDREPLVDLLQSTPPDKLLPAVIAKINAGVTLPELVGAAALANARAFGGDDYVGFHTLMALAPSLAMSKHMRLKERPLPVLKVLYRNSTRLAEVGGNTANVLQPVGASEPSPGADVSEFLRRCVHEGQLAPAEQTLAGVAARSPQQALEELLPVVEEAPEVHRVVLVQRAWEMLELVGPEHAATMLRQSLHYCVKNEKSSANYFGAARGLLPKLFDQHQLEGRSLGNRMGDSAWLEGFMATLWKATPEQAADAATAALREGFAPAAIAEAVGLTANQLLLRDIGRTGNQVQPNKPAGSVHGDSIGVHACDSANAWRQLAGIASARRAQAATILSAYQVALDRTQRGGNFHEWKPLPSREVRDKVSSKGVCVSLKELQDAIKANEQELACAITRSYLDCGQSPSHLWSAFAHASTRDDGALHAEKFFRTAYIEYGMTRQEYRNRHLIALARVVASQANVPAPGYDEAKWQLG